MGEHGLGLVVPTLDRPPPARPRDLADVGGEVAHGAHDDRPPLEHGGPVLRHEEREHQQRHDLARVRLRTGGEGMLSSRNIHTMPAGGWQRRGKLDGGGEKLDGGVWLEGGGGVPGTGV